MFAKTIIDSDSFLDMPLSAQALYMHLSMRADDDGFVNNPKRIQRLTGASEDDLRLLFAKSFIIAFDTGIIVIKHWRINNYLRGDRYKPTVYQDEMRMLTIKENGAYTLSETLGIPNGYQMDTNGIPNGYQMDTQISIDKNSKDKDSKEKSTRFAPPSVDEVSAYLTEKGYDIDAEAFVDFYASKGWKVGNSPMKDWKAAVRTWVNRRKEETPAPKPKSPQTGGTQANNPFKNYDQHQYSDDEFAEMERAMMRR